MSGKAIFVLGIIILVTCVVSDWAFGKFFKWLGKYVMKHKDAKFVQWLKGLVLKHDERKERKKRKFITVTQKTEDCSSVPLEELYKKSFK